MTFPKEIEHGGYPTSETRTIGDMRRDADAYAGIRAGRKMQSGLVKPFVKKTLDNKNGGVVSSVQNLPIAAELQPTTQETQIMTLTLKGLSKNGKAAFYTGSAQPIRLSLASFVGKTAPQTIEIADGIFTPAKAPKVKMTKEERKAAQAAKPKPTLAEKVAAAKAKADKLAAELAASEQPAL